MKLYAEKHLNDEHTVFNYGLSRFRRVSENCFGILMNRHPDTVILILTASIVLHNMLRTKSSDSYTPPAFANELLPDGTLTNGSRREEDFASIISPSGVRKKANKSKDACFV